MASCYGKGGCLEAPTSAWCRCGSRLCGASGGNDPARARPAPRAGGGCAEKTERAEGQSRCQEKRRRGRGGRTEKGRAAMLAMLFIVLLPRVTRKENKEPQSKGCNTCEGRRYFCPLTSPGVSALGFPCQRRCARWRETSRLSVEGRPSAPEFRAPNTGRPVSPGGERVAVASSRLIPAGLILFPTRRRCLCPFNNLQLLLVFPDILCFSLSLLSERRG